MLTEDEMAQAQFKELANIIFELSNKLTQTNAVRFLEMQKVDLLYGTQVDTQEHELTEAKNQLLALVEQNPHLFEGERKSQTVSGVRFGFQMAKGRYVLPKDIVARVRAIMPEKAPLLIETSEKVTVSAIKTIAKEELEKLGVIIDGAGDHAFVNVEGPQGKNTTKALKKSA